MYLVAKKLVLALNVDGDLILNRVEGALPSTRKAFNDRPAKAEVMNEKYKTCKCSNERLKIQSKNGL